MFTKKGWVIILIAFLSWKVAEPMSDLFSEALFSFYWGLQIALTLITAGVMTKVFTIVFSNNEKPDRFLFISLNIWSKIMIIIGLILSVIWFFIH